MFGSDMRAAGWRAYVAVWMPPIIWVIALGFAAYLFVRDALTARFQNDLSINGFAIWGRDFVNVFTSGRLVIEDKLTILYDPRLYQAWQTAEFGAGIRTHNYSYPPVTLLYTPVFGALPYLWALALWTLLSLLSFVLAARPWLRRASLPTVLGAIIPTTIVCIWAGHYGLLVGALWLAAWHNLDKRPALAGMLTGLMIVKPHMAVLMPLMFLRRRAWVAIASATATVALLVGISILIFGLDLWQIYLTKTSGDQLQLVSATRAFFINMMPTVAPALFAYGFPTTTVWTIQFGVAAIALTALWRFAPAEAHLAGLAAAVATFLVLPYAFNYDMTIIGLAAVLMIYRPDARSRSLSVLIAATVVILPPTLIYLNRAGYWIAPAALALFLFDILAAGHRDKVRAKSALDI
jgi:alpha-1,2-mannosyltransferase